MQRDFEPINIAMICDKNYVVPTKTLINSIVKNKHSKDKLNIIVVGVALDENDRNSFAQFKDEDVNIKVLNPTDSFDEIKIQHVHVSKAALYKMILPNILPEINKVIYLDSDMLVLDSLSDLYATDIGDVYVGAVVDLVAEVSQKHHERLGVDHYFNSGMLMLNLEKLRQDNLVEKLINRRKEDTSNYFMDQDVFNWIMREKVRLLSPRYNRMLTTYRYMSEEEEAKYNNMSVSQLREMKETAVIWHYTNKDKPWNKLGVPEWETWFQYVCEEDIFSILATYIRNFKEKEAEISRLNNTLSFIRRQDKANLEYCKNGMENIANKLGPTTQSIYDNRKEIIAKTKLDADNHKIVIYGAGAMGQLFYKLLYNNNMQSQVAGFAVENKYENVECLFDLDIKDINEYITEDIFVVFAVKGNVNQLKNKLEKNIKILDLNEWL